MYVIDKEQEEKEIQSKYDELIQLCWSKNLISTKKDENTIYRAFIISKNAVDIKASISATNKENKNKIKFSFK